MKKLTAGIFTVLLGVVAANSADAALTSKAYVDAKVKVNADAIAAKADTATVNALDGRVTTAEGTIKTHGTDIADLKTNKQNKLKSGTGIEIDEATNTISTKGIATSDALTALEGKVTANTGDITTLKGEGEGSVKKSIADAIAAEVTRSDGAYDAKGAAGTAETNAKAYADGLAKNYATAAQGKTADDTAAAVNNATTGLATKASKTYVDDELAKKQNTLTEAQLNAVNSGITEAKVTTYDGYADKITAAQTQADKGVADAAAAKTVADKAIPKPTADCTTLGAKCVLVVGESGYAWESVERATGEATGA